MKAGVAARTAFIERGSDSLFELMHYGDRIEGAATNIRFKSVKDSNPKIHNFRCEWINRGLHWKKNRERFLSPRGRRDENCQNGRAC